MATIKGFSPTGPPKGKVDIDVLRLADPGAGFVTGNPIERETRTDAVLAGFAAAIQTMSRLRRIGSLQKFASVHASLHNHFSLERHLADRQTYKERRSIALAEWQIIAS